MNAKSPSTSKHTPGPWKLAKTIGGNPAIESEHDQRFSVAIVPAQGLAAYANARLIAAAPELLVALCDALPIVEDACEFMKDDFKPGVLSRLKAQIRAAIAKAEGSANV